MVMTMPWRCIDDNFMNDASMKIETEDALRPLAALRWYKVRLCFLPKTFQSKYLPIDIFQAILKHVSSSMAGPASDPSIFYHIKDRSWDYKIKPAQVVPVEVIFCRHDLEFVAAWLSKLKEYLAGEYSGRNFGLLRVGRIEERSLCDLECEYDISGSETEVGLNFLVPFPFRKTEKVGHISKEAFVSAFGYRISRLFGGDFSYMSARDDFDIKLNWRFTSVPRPSKQTHWVIGCTGKMSVKGTFHDFLPFLLLCSELHVVSSGFAPTYSRGYYRIEGFGYSDI